MQDRVVVTPIDLAAELFGISRYSLEPYSDFVNRLKSMYNGDWKPDSTYIGLLWGTLIELGLPLLPYGTIETTIPSSYIEINPTGIVLSNDLEYLSNSCIKYNDDKSVSFYTPEVSGGTSVDFSGFVSMVSGSSSFSIHQDVVYPGASLTNFFVDTPLFRYFDDTPSGSSLTFSPFNFMFGNNIRLEYETLPFDRDYIVLKHQNLVSGSVVFNNLEKDFRAEVSGLSEICQHGDYFIDYTSGTIKVFDRKEAVDRNKKLEALKAKTTIDFFNVVQNKSQLYREAVAYTEPIKIVYRYYEWPYRILITPIQFIIPLDVLAKRLMYNVYGQNNSYDRIRTELGEQVITELRDANVSYK